MLEPDEIKNCGFGYGNVCVYMYYHARGILT